MTININWKSVVMVAGAIATVYAAYKLAKAAEKEEEQLNAHKEEKLADRDINEELNNATIKNEKFDVADRAKAYEVLCRYAHRINDARSIKEFDEALCDYDEALADLSSDNLDEALACLLIYKDKQDKFDRAQKEKKDDERERKRNQIEKDKALMIADAIKKFNTSVNGKNDPLSNFALNISTGGRR